MFSYMQWRKNMRSKIGFLVVLLCSLTVAGVAQASTIVAGSYGITISGTDNLSVVKNFASPFSMPRRKASTG